MYSFIQMREHISMVKCKIALNRGVAAVLHQAIDIF